MAETQDQSLQVYAPHKRVNAQQTSKGEWYFEVTVSRPETEGPILPEVLVAELGALVSARQAEWRAKGWPMAGAPQ